MHSMNRTLLSRLEKLEARHLPEPADDGALERVMAMLDLIEERQRKRGNWQEPTQEELDAFLAEFKQSMRVLA
jgi:hypothetical protein